MANNSALNRLQQYFSLGFKPNTKSETDMIFPLKKDIKIEKGKEIVTTSKQKFDGEVQDLFKHWLGNTWDKQNSWKSREALWDDMDVLYMNCPVITRAIELIADEVIQADSNDQPIFIDAKRNVKKYIQETNNDLIYFNDEIQRFNDFRSKGLKKDRSDHRQHALDAFIVAACSPKITQMLSTYYAHQEELNLENREKIERNFDYEELKQSIKSILVSHTENQSFIKKRINRFNTKEGLKESVTYAPQGKLHEESFYAKRNGVTVRRVKLFDPQAQEKVSFISPEKLNYNGKGEKWAYIDDSALYEITKERLEKYGKKAFTKEMMEQEPFFRASPNFLGTTTSKKGKQLPIVKSVRKRFIADKTLIQLPAKDEKGNIINENRYVDNETNAILVLYEKDNFDNKGKKKKPLREFELISYYQYVEKKRKGEILFSDEKNEIGLKNNLNWVQKGDFIAIYENDNELNNYLQSPETIPTEKIYKVKGITADSRIINGAEYSYGYITKVSHHNMLDEKTISHTKFNFIKIKLNILGEIECVL